MTPAKVKSAVESKVKDAKVYAISTGNVALTFNMLYGTNYEYSAIGAKMTYMGTSFTMTFDKIDPRNKTTERITLSFTGNQWGPSTTDLAIYNVIHFPGSSFYYVAYKSGSQYTFFMLKMNGDAIQVISSPTSFTSSYSRVYLETLNYFVWLDTSSSSDYIVMLQKSSGTSVGTKQFGKNDTVLLVPGVYTNDSFLYCILNSNTIKLYKTTISGIGSTTESLLETKTLTTPINTYVGAGCTYQNNMYFILKENNVVKLYRASSSLSVIQTNFDISLGRTKNYLVTKSENEYRIRNLASGNLIKTISVDNTATIYSYFQNAQYEYDRLPYRSIETDDTIHLYDGTISNPMISLLTSERFVNGKSIVRLASSV